MLWIIPCPACFRFFFSHSLSFFITSSTCSFMILEAQRCYIIMVLMWFVLLIMSVLLVHMLEILPLVCWCLCWTNTRFTRDQVCRISRVQCVIEQCLYCRFIRFFFIVFLTFWSILLLERILIKILELIVAALLKIYQAILTHLKNNIWKKFIVWACACYWRISLAVLFAKLVSDCSNGLFCRRYWQSYIRSCLTC